MITVSTDPGPGAVFGKLAQVLAEVHRVPKRGKNRHFSYDFVTESDLTDFLRPKLAEAGLGLVVSVDGVTEEENGRIMVTGTVIVGDESGAWISGSLLGEARDVARDGSRQDKGINKAITAAVKYWLLKTFLVSTGDDTELDENNPPHATPSPPAQPSEDVRRRLTYLGAYRDRLSDDESRKVAALQVAIQQRRWDEMDTEAAEAWILEMYTRMTRDQPDV